MNTIPYRLLALFLSILFVIPSLLAGKRQGTYSLKKRRCKLATQNITKFVTTITTKHHVSSGELDRWLPPSCRQGSKQSVKALLQRGADPNSTLSSYYTPLEIAIYRRSPGIVMLLLEYGADPFKISQSGISALEYASKRRYSNIACAIENNVSEKETSHMVTLLKRQPDDLITGEPLSPYKLSDLIVLNGKLWTKNSLMKHVLYKIGTEHGPRDPFTNIPIERGLLVRLAAHTGIPFREIDHTQKVPGRLSLLGIARCLVPLESSLSICDCAVSQENVDQLKRAFNTQLKKFNRDLAASVHTN